MFCKNCRFWAPYVDNNMLHPPGRKRHACTLRLHTVSDEEGEVAVYPSILPNDEKGPRFGERTGPKDTCEYIVKKHAPYKNEKRIEKPSWKRIRQLRGLPSLAKVRSIRRKVVRPSLPQGGSPSEPGA